MEKAIENYTQAAALGDELSMNQIGYIYLGEEGGETNPKQAFYWFNEAAKKALMWECTILDAAIERDMV